MEFEEMDLLEIKKNKICNLRNLYVWSGNEMKPCSKWLTLNGHSGVTETSIPQAIFQGLLRIAHYNMYICQTLLTTPLLSGEVQEMLSLTWGSTRNFTITRNYEHWVNSQILLRLKILIHNDNYFKTQYCSSGELTKNQVLLLAWTRKE